MDAQCHNKENQSPLTEDCKMMCNTFSQILLEDINEIPPLFPMDQLDSGLGDELTDSIVLEKEEKVCDHKISQNCSKSMPDCSKDQIHALFCGDEDGDSLLHISILQEDESIVFRIIQMAPDFTYLCAANHLGQTALHLAVLTRRSRIVRRLVCAGAAVDAQDKSGNNPLHLACAFGYCDIAQHLLKPVQYKETLFNNYKIPYQGIPLNMNLRNFDGSTCLHLAIVNNHFDVLRLILDVGIDVHMGHGKSGRTALHLAADFGNIEMLALLIENKDVNVDEPDFDGVTSFQLAFGRGHLEAQRILIQNGAVYKNLNFEEESDTDMSLDSL